MQALVLVGGEGTRLRPLTYTRPKPALPLVDRPFIRFMVDWLAHHGVTEVLMACGFQPKALRAALGEGGGGGPRIRYLEEQEPLGTGGPIRLAADEGFLAERFLALNGDVLADLDLSALVSAHEATGAAATLGLYPVGDPSSYGLVRRRADGAVTGFLEKPAPAQIDTDEVNAGTYVLERRVIDLIPPGRAVSIEREVFPRLVGRGLYGQRLEGYWMDIGTPERYLDATWDILEGRVRTDVVIDGSGVLVHPGAAVDPGARVGPRVVIGPGSAIGEGATIERSVLLEGCQVKSGAAVADSILGSHVQVEEGARVRRSVLGDEVRVVAGASLDEGSRVPPGETAR